MTNVEVDHYSSGSEDTGFTHLALVQGRRGKVWSRSIAFSTSAVAEIARLLMSLWCVCTNSRAGIAARAALGFCWDH